MTRRDLAALAAAGLMLFGAAAPHWLRPAHRLADYRQRIDLAADIPERFASWQAETIDSALLVNPQGGELQRRIYQQVLARNYIDRSSGQRVMLSIAYGENQNRNNDLHVPDVCYPAAGFRIAAHNDVVLSTAHGPVQARQLVTQRLQRHEPLTYWAIVGEHVASSALDAKLAALAYGLRGWVPDGLIFRVSTLDPSDDDAFATQQRFVNDLLGALSPDLRHRLAGL